MFGHNYKLLIFYLFSRKELLKSTTIPNIPITNRSFCLVEIFKKVEVSITIVISRLVLFGYLNGFYYRNSLSSCFDKIFSSRIPQQSH